MKKILYICCILFIASHLGYAQNLLDTSTWTEGQDPVQGFYGTPTVEQSIRVHEPGPFEEPVLTWKATPDDDGDQHGGGLATVYHTIDHTFAYRFVIWLKKKGTDEGLSYLGAWGPSHVLDIYYGNVDDNPLFLAADLPEKDTWYLAVGFIQNSAYDSTESHGRLYDTSGNEIGILRDFKWATWSTRVALRAFSYFDTNPANELFLYEPRMEPVNPLMPSVEELLDLGAPTVLEFAYDQSGNQILRQPPSNGIQENSTRAILVDDDSLNTETPLPLLVDDTRLPDYLGELEASITIHPNPTAGELFVSWHERFQDMVVDVVASDFSGRAIPVNHISGTLEAEVDLSLYPSGIYLVAFQLSDGRQIEKKIIKE